MLKMKTVAISAVLTLSASAFAGLGDKLERKWDESTGISRIYLGHSNEASNLGMSHERREGALGIEGMLMIAADNGDPDTPEANKYGQTLFGVSLIHHLQDNSNADVYFGTGFSYIRHEDVEDSDGDEDDVNSFGPMFKIGSNYYINNDWSLGLEYITAMNWSSDEVAAQSNYGFVTLGYTY